MIRIVKEPDGAGPPYERCCFCWRPTTWWHAKKDVAVCPECAATRKTAEIPKKADWCKQTAGLDARPAEAEALQVGVDAVRDAARPFIEIANGYSEAEDDSHEIWVDAAERFTRITLGQCRALRDALSSAPAQEDGSKDLGWHPRGSGQSAGEVERLHEALARAQAWHEREDKALSKSGRGDADYYWRRSQHREQLDMLRSSLSAAEYDAAWDRIDTRDAYEDDEPPLSDSKAKLSDAGSDAEGRG